MIVVSPFTSLDDPKTITAHLTSPGRRQPWSAKCDTVIRILLLHSMLMHTEYYGALNPTLVFSTPYKAVWRLDGRLRERERILGDQPTIPLGHHMLS